MRFIIFSIALLVGFTLRADDRMFFDKEGKRTQEENASYYRVANKFPVEDRFRTTDFFMDGSVAVSAEYLSSSHKIRDGRFMDYYPNGQKKSEGRYKDNLKLGPWRFWYPNGQLMKEAYAVQTNETPSKEILLVMNFWNEDGHLMVEKGKGAYIEYDLTTVMAQDLRVLSEGRVLDGLKHGRWFGYNHEGDLLYKELYKSGVLMNGKSLTDTDKKRYTVVSQPPKPKGGIANLRKHIYKSLRQPRTGSELAMKGEVLVQFVVEKDGTVRDIETIRGLGEGYDQEAERVIETFGQWKPGVQRGEYRTSRMVMPISFGIQ